MPDECGYTRSRFLHAPAIDWFRSDALKGALANMKWLEVPAVGAGIFVTEETRAEVRVDNIAVYLLRGGPN